VGQRPIVGFNVEEIDFSGGILLAYKTSEKGGIALLLPFVKVYFYEVF
jgi:hypothetical protein